MFWKDVDEDTGRHHRGCHVWLGGHPISSGQTGVLQGLILEDNYLNIALAWTWACARHTQHARSLCDGQGGKHGICRLSEGLVAFISNTYQDVSTRSKRLNRRSPHNLLCLEYAIGMKVL